MHWRKRPYSINNKENRAGDHQDALRAFVYCTADHRHPVFFPEWARAWNLSGASIVRCSDIANLSGSDISSTAIQFSVKFRDCMPDLYCGADRDRLSGSLRIRIFRISHEKAAVQSGTDDDDDSRRGSRDHKLHNNSEPASDEYLRRTGGYFSDFWNVYFPDA